MSPIRLKDGEYASGKTWMLVALNSRMSEVLQTNTAGAANLWPKLHTHSLCPGRLATISLAIFTGPAAPLI